MRGGSALRSSKNVLASPEPSSPWTPRQAQALAWSSPSARKRMRDAHRQVRIAIADDHQIFRDGLKRLLESEPGFKVVAEAADGVDAVRVAREAKPDILLLDVAMPRMGGIEAMCAPDVGSTRVILLTAAIDPGELLLAVQLGARGVVLKESATRDL